MLFHTEQTTRFQLWGSLQGTPWGYSIIKQAFFDSHVLNKRRIQLQGI